MGKCCVRGCRNKARLDFQTKKWNSVGRIDSFGFCYEHGIYMSRAEIDFSLEHAMSPNKRKTNYKQRAKVKSYGEALTSVLVQNKDTLPLSNYSDITGKRFRMTKDQKDRKISRQEAFSEFIAEV